MSRHGSRRLAFGLCLAIFLAGTFTGGLCFMQVGASGGPASAKHDCCKAGMAAKPPACCMSTISTDAPARQVPKSTLQAPHHDDVLAASSAVRLLQAAEPVKGAAVPRRPEPPPLVLRI